MSMTFPTEFLTNVELGGNVEGTLVYTTQIIKTFRWEWLTTPEGVLVATAVITATIILSFTLKFVFKFAVKIPLRFILGSKKSKPPNDQPPNL